MSGQIYFIQRATGGPIKIGYSADVATRLADLQIGSPEPLIILGYRPGTQEMEQHLHRVLAAHHERGEWFKDCPEVRAEFVRVLTSPPPAPPMAREDFYPGLNGSGDIGDQAIISFFLLLDKAYGHLSRAAAARQIAADAGVTVSTARGWLNRENIPRVPSMFAMASRNPLAGCWLRAILTRADPNFVAEEE